MNCISNSSMVSEDETAKRARIDDHKQEFMDAMTLSMNKMVQAISKSTEDSNKLKLMEFLTPTRRATMASRMFADMSNVTDITMNGATAGPTSPLTTNSNTNSTIYEA